MTNTAPYSAIDIPEAMNRNQAARDIVFRIRRSHADARPRMGAHPSRSRRRSRPGHRGDQARRRARGHRLRHANAVAAMRATIAAQRDGESDPLYYLRDELNSPQSAPEARRGGNRD